MNFSNKLLYKIRNILFILFLYGSIRLLPNIKNNGILGIIFIILIILYSLVMFYCFARKEEKLNNNYLQNFLVIMLYLYVFIIAKKYVDSLGNSTYIINNMYFIINYCVISIGMIGIGIDNLLLLNIKK